MAETCPPHETGEGTRESATQDWNTRAGLPFYCSSSHPEIRYQEETCPLCEALKERLWIVANLIAAAGGVIDVPDALVNIEGDNRVVSRYPILAESLTRWTVSRPSSDHGAKPKCLPHGQGRIGCWQEQLVGGEWVTNHSTACPTLKPGAGEVGK